MAGIRLINTLPETFRFPEWRDDIFYAADSMVRYASYMAPLTDSDSDNLKTKFYIALQDIDPNSGIPPLRLDLWGTIASDATAIGTVVGQIIDNDSDIAWLRANAANIVVEHDSDINILKIDHDSDLSMTYHDFRAADSDIQYGLDSDINWIKARLIVLEDEKDSDIAITRTDHDSDLSMTYHDFRAADSDFQVIIDSEFHDLNSFDSDVNQLLTLPSWDYGSFF